MKKTMKKLLAGVSATILCASPMISSMSASAATSYEDTYRVYFDVPAESELNTYSLIMVYTEDMSEVYVENGNLGGTFNVTEATSGTTTNVFKGTYTSGGSLVSSGTIFKIKIFSNGHFLNNINSLTGTAKNVAGMAINPSPVTRDVVLVGDANDTKTVDVADAVYIKQYLADPESTTDFKFRSADVNGDNVITVDDAELIQQYCADIITHF